jgi:hypothetical protein
MPLSCVVIHRRPTVEIRVDGNVVPDVTGCDWAYGAGKVPCEGSFTVLRLPSYVQARAPLEIHAGATDATTYLRCKGQVVTFPNYAYAPREIQVTGNGDLVKAQRILTSEDVEEDDGDTDVPGTPLGGLAQAAQIIAVLNAQGLAGFYDPALIGGPPHILGTVAAAKAGAKLANVWKRSQAGLDFCFERDKIGLGYRLLEGPLPTAFGGGFGIYRPQISPRPGPASVTLTAGIDVGRDTSAAHDDALGVFNYVRVRGGDYGEGQVSWAESAPHPHPDPLVAFQPSPPYTSPLIEKRLASDAGPGISAQEIALWQIVEVCQVQLRAEVSTPRSDLFRLEQSIHCSGTFDRLEIEQDMWCRQVSGSVKAGQVFRQKLSLRAPAAVGVGGIAIPQERRAQGTVFFGMPTYGSLRGAA